MAYLEMWSWNGRLQFAVNYSDKIPGDRLGTLEGRFKVPVEDEKVQQLSVDDLVNVMEPLIAPIRSKVERRMLS